MSSSWTSSAILKMNSRMWRLRLTGPTSPRRRCQKVHMEHRTSAAVTLPATRTTCHLAAPSVELTSHEKLSPKLKSVLLNLKSKRKSRAKLWRLCSSFESRRESSRRRIWRRLKLTLINRLIRLSRRWRSGSKSKLA